MLSTYCKMKTFCSFLSLVLNYIKNFFRNNPLEIVYFHSFLFNFAVKFIKPFFITQYG
ncbi:hypothetical protein BACCOP_03400 [Phocaeicola coprocola DSM 17136]|uniref:Uncharacterized protein n=1 Tax=Phocaeicola coprocola DSM 17136 TaxID=470145 RepID=B3JN88_9BACT|nr:hypothetical protein BACCOP_03400 [Phocaeicola coprocola DSM 17136]